MAYRIPELGKLDVDYNEREDVMHLFIKKRCIRVDYGSAVKDLNKIIRDLSSRDAMNNQLDAATHICAILAKNNTPIDLIARHETLVPLLVELLNRDDKPELQLKAAWALSYVTYGTTDETDVVIKSGAVPVLVRLLDSSSNPDIRENIVCALGNIAGDSPENRDLVLRHGALLPLRHQFIGDETPTLMQKAAWAICNLCRGNPRPAPELIIPALYEFQHLIFWDNVEMLINACLALLCLSEGGELEYEAIITSGVLSRVVGLLNHNHVFVITAVLRTLVNLLKHEGGMIVPKAGGSCMNIIMREGLHSLSIVLSHNCYTSSHKAQVCWIVSRIVGPNGVVQAIIDSELIRSIFMLFADERLRDIATLAMRNVACCATPDEIRSVVDVGCMEFLPMIFSVTNKEGDEAAKNCFVLLHHILKVDSMYKHMIGEDLLYNINTYLSTRVRGSAIWELACHLVRMHWLHKFHVWTGEELKHVK